MKQVRQQEVRIHSHCADRPAFTPNSKLFRADS